MRPEGSDWAELRHELRFIGRGQRVLNLIVATVLLISSGLAFRATGNPTGLLLAGVPAVVGVVLSFRVKALVEDRDVLVVVGHFRTHRIPLIDTDASVATPYEGWWNGFAGSDNRLNLRLRMIDIELRRGRGISLPQTMCSKRRAY